MTARPLPAGRYRLDPVHTFAAFSVRHLLVGRVDGRFNTITGAFVVTADPERPLDLVEVGIEAASVDTQVKARDEDLRSARFFDAPAFPSIGFRGHGTATDREDVVLVAGDLTIRDITRPVSFDVAVRGATTDPRGRTRMGATATTALWRRDFGLTAELEQESGDSRDPDIHVRLDVEALLE